MKWDKNIENFNFNHSFISVVLSVTPYGLKLLYNDILSNILKDRLNFFQIYVVLLGENDNKEELV